jgi:hypothetical protein
MMMFDPSAVKLKKREPTKGTQQKPVEQPVNPLSNIKLRTNTTPVKRREEPPQQPPPFTGVSLKKVPKKEPIRKVSSGNLFYLNISDYQHKYIPNHQNLILFKISNFFFPLQI